MVGVAGKFKGCNTCREKRVKCDNQKPECQKCRDTGRICGGYERERVFIIGTADDRGRCSSHPHRSLSAKSLKSTKSTKSRLENNARVRKRAISSPPLKRDVNVRLNHEFGRPMVKLPDPPSTKIHCIALQTKLARLTPVATNVDQHFALPSLEYIEPSLSSGPDFSMKGVCLSAGSPVQQPLFDENYLDSSSIAGTSVFNPFVGGETMPAIGEHSSNLSLPSTNTSRNSSLSSSSTCLFLYESNPSSRRSSADPSVNIASEAKSKGNSGSPWKNILGGNSDDVYQQGPDAYKQFPEHYFFTRLFRPNACFDAISQRRKTFLAEEEWCKEPWREIAKTDMDRLLDIQVLLPDIFEEGEGLQNLFPSIARRLQAKQLLEKCLRLDHRLEDWHRALLARHGGEQYSVVRSVSNLSSNIQPLSDEQFRFVDHQYAFLHIYFWATKVLFYRAVQHVHTIASEPIPTTTSTSHTPPQPLFTPQPFVTQPLPMSMPAMIDNYQQPYTFSHDPLSFMNATPTTTMSYFPIQTAPQLYTPSTEDIFHFHQAVLDPTTPIVPNQPIIPFYFNVEPYMDTSGTNSTGYDGSEMGSEVLGGSAASYTSQSRSGTPAHQQQQQQQQTSVNLSSYPLQSSRNLDFLHETYQAPPPPSVPALDKKYSESEILTFANNICHALPFILTSETTRTSSSLASTPSPVARRGSTFSTTFSNTSSNAASPFRQGSPLIPATSTTRSAIPQPPPPLVPPNYATPQVEQRPQLLLSEFGPDAAFWPLKAATKVFKRQERTEEFQWCLRMMDTLRNDAAEVVAKAKDMLWKEWPQ